MKRWIGSIVLSGVVAVGFAQSAPFTIVRPADGSQVREQVHIQIPKNSIPPGGYVGVFLDGKLLEAVVPPLKGKFYEYILDTKARGIPDTPSGQTQKLELILYTDYNEKARIVDRSSVNISIGNQAKIPIPNAGIKLRYKFVPGQDMIYDLDQHIEVSPMTESDNESGGKAATFDSEGETLRLSYSVVNAYGDGDGLLRLQALPLKGKDYADITASGGTEQKRYYDTDMAPLYMRISSTGNQKFGALPAYYGFDGSVVSFKMGGLFAAFPLPTLPQKAIHVNDSWQSHFQGGKLDLQNWSTTDSVVQSYPARGQFMNVEWERGHPCARIQNVIEESTESDQDKKLTNKNTEFKGDKVKIQETIWFALDSHKILKIERDQTVDKKIENQGAFGGMGAPGGMGGPGMSGGPGMPGGPGMSGRPGMQGAGGGGGAGSSDVTGPLTNMQFSTPGAAGRGGQGRNRPGGGIQRPGMGGRPGMGMPPGMGGGRPGMGMPPGAGGQSGQSAQATFVRLHILQTFTLEL